MSQEEQLAIHQYNQGFTYLYGSSDTEQNYFMAFDLLSQSASQNYVPAMMALGNMYRDGCPGFLESNDEKAFEWYEKSADLGEHYGQLFVGDAYSFGKGIRVDKSKAVEYYSKSALQNNQFAQYTLGMIYKEGNGVRIDLSASLHWLQKASEQGNEEATREFNELSKLIPKACPAPPTTTLDLCIGEGGAQVSIADHEE
ncbi:predicted protein [Naegleria gruberi]|uniref:Predicted protein n=1 Tax=Naegleria gruberi TaxID=5762 RepID=D2UZ38_NAEGR|nr:uncharacterized protein NAEGRDRAFT_61800 [Naegleria gruberi]EFC50084.1 predicted protein [Naegleria gruberi]|eukprot:XP_002682828.1 predicted protein [Naegleria gruberi strain NEG-M]